MVPPPPHAERERPDFDRDDVERDEDELLGGDSPDPRSEPYSAARK
jgi:hypothetical protein